ncbi:hypothetical protein QFC19_009253 [Naganishia cerealis]|uniref:Uncharacterized protein n=1 Tax=Naganishia cerealis TaxID=610337 RepID=A0ACC2UWI5_9TREE|nr:hypothetical protein QFC19_009253 [Naganishia cerealis]
MNRLFQSARTLRRIRPRFPVQRAFSVSQPSWEPPHVAYPATPTKEQSYATPLLPLPSPPTQPASKALLLLYVPYPPSRWPSHLEIEDPFVDQVGKLVALHGTRLVVCYDGNDSDKQHAYRAKLFAPGGLIKSYPTITSSTLTSTDFLSTLDSLSTTHQPTQPTPPRYTEILVCTHGARDCRCSDIGGDLVLALRAEVKRRGEQLLPPGEEAERDLAQQGLHGSDSRRWKITECAHVGGHKWAANAILLPSSTFLSNLRPTHVPLLLDSLAHPDDAELRRQLWTGHFRGVIGKTVEQQVEAWEAVVRTTPPQPPALKASSTSLSSSGTSSLAPKAPTTTPKRTPLVVRFTTHDGETHDVRGYEGESLMDVAKREGLGAVEGTCGGHCGTYSFPPHAQNP